MAFYSNFVATLRSPRTSLLSFAVRNNWIGTARFALRIGADKNVVDAETGNTLLHKATSTEMADLLIASGLSLETANTNRETPLITMLRANRTSLAQFLIQKGAQLNVKDRTGSSPLHLATDHSLLQNILTTITPEALNAVDSNGNTAVNYAIISGHIEKIILLLEKGARTDIENHAGQKTALEVFQAKITNNPHPYIEPGVLKAIAERLLQSDKNPYVSTPIIENWTSDFGYSLPNYVLRTCGADSVRALFNRDNVNTKDTNGRAALHFAAAAGNLPAVAALLEMGADPTSTDLHGLPPLFYAASSTSNTDEVMKLLKSQGANPNQIVATYDFTHLEATILHVAAQLSYASHAITNLIKFGANPNAQDQASGATPNVPAAAAQATPEVIAGRTPLHLAVRYPDNVRSLLAGGAKIMPDSKGNTPIQYAAQTAEDIYHDRRDRNTTQQSEAIRAYKESLLALQTAPKPGLLTAVKDFVAKNTGLQNLVPKSTHTALAATTIGFGTIAALMRNRA